MTCFKTYRNTWATNVSRVLLSSLFFTISLAGGVLENTLMTSRRNRLSQNSPVSRPKTDYRPTIGAT